MGRKIILFDTETTGLLKPSAAGIKSQPYITELYGVKIDEDFNVIGEFESYFKIPVPVPPFITKITGIKDSDLEGAPTFEEASEKLKDFIEDATETVAHNHSFDKAMVLNQFVRAGYKDFNWPAIETCTVIKAMPIEQRRISLTNLHKYLFGKDFPSAHRAKNDVHALVRCYHAMRERGLCV